MPSRAYRERNEMATIDPRVLALIGDKPLFGSTGRIASQYVPGGGGGSEGFFNPDQAPDWLKGQYQSVDQSEGGNGFKKLGGSLRDKNGREVHQIGENDSDEKVIDWNGGKVWYDPELGPVTTPDNVERKDRGGTMEKVGKGALAAAALYVTGGMAGMYGAPGAAAAGEMVGPAASNMAFDFSTMPALDATTVGGLGADFVPSAATGGGGGLGALGAEGELVGPPASAMNFGADSMASLPETVLNTQGDFIPSLSPTTVGSMGTKPSLLSQASQYAMKNPGMIARGAMGLAALGAGSGGGGGGGPGGNTDASSIIDQMAQANRVNQNTPLGSRNWVKDPVSGQWTVNDTMNPNEQANFTNVQGLNGGITDMARARLAALLAQPPRQRADRPIGA